jgi:serine/threonine protein kinase
VFSVGFPPIFLLLLLTYFQIIMEFCDAGSCISVMQRQGSPFTEPQIAATLRQVVDALVYLHGRKPPICHRGMRRLSRIHLCNVLG